MNKEAKKALGVEGERIGGVADTGYWVWRLPKGAATKDADPISEALHS